MKILDELYYGNVNGSERPTAYREEVKETDNLVKRNYETLLALLNDEQKTHLQKLRDCLDEQSGIDERYTFLCGFRLGVRLMAEVFADK